ncbi:pyruvate carboxyltransferase (plasmid) [Streptomyces violaceusniger Tu 4113]|uniref:2-isopropylmalate synthase n=1 Tax=Streptomyces violaceusniger (strain Tu 4113) TaxID=653045 RepID=G2PH09_STRV4|nr:pyruvate carboxyltransferase [Streptomyces violaceusniger]AEM88583.1 pyruvate carboxyltransferase [Streptomyces violaceusniger Tu 4113]
MTSNSHVFARRLRVFDSTLRDGEQAPGNAMNPEQKLELALAIEATGVDTIEAGFPSSSPSDFEATKLIAQALTTAKVATLNRAVRADIQLAAEAGGIDHQIQIMATGSDVHLEHKRGITRAEGLKEIVDSVRFARELGFTDITLGIEDASRGSDDLLRPMIEAGVAEGARTVALADTTGCLIPSEFGAQVTRVRSWIHDDIILSIHCHQDLGLSLANALAGIDAGADEVQSTLAGIGERAGNTPLEELAAVLLYKAEQLGVTSRLRTEKLYDAYLILSRIIGLPTPRNKAVFGENSFATQAGIHQAGMLRNPVTYEYVEPHRFGRERGILIGRHSGRNVIRNTLDQMGLGVESELLDAIYDTYIASREDGTCIELGELRHIITERLGHATASAAPSDLAVTAP